MTVDYRLQDSGFVIYDNSPEPKRILPEHDSGLVWEEIEQPGFDPHSWGDESNPDFDVDEHVCAFCGEPVGFYLYADRDDGYGGIDHLRWAEMFKLITDLPEYQGTYLCADHVPAEDAVEDPEWWVGQGYLYGRKLDRTLYPDIWVIVVDTIFNWRLAVCTPSNVLEFWCYPKNPSPLATLAHVLEAATVFDGQGDPLDGWVKHFPSNRRRPTQKETP